MLYTAIEDILEHYGIRTDAVTTSGQTAAEVLEAYIEQGLDVIEETLID